MSNAIVSNVYRYVIDDVINQVRGDFEDMGIDDSVLQELQRSWESKVARSRVANFGFKEDGYYEDEHGTDTNANIMSAVNSSNDPQLQYTTDYTNPGNGPPPAASLANLAANAINNNRPLPPPQSQSPYGMPPLNNNRVIPDPNTLVNQYQMMHPSKLTQNNTLPELQLPSISRPNLPQNDGANDMTTQEIDRHIEDIIQSSQEEEEFEFTASSFSGEPIALDSLPESVKELMKEAKQRAMKAGALSKKTRIPQLDGEDDEQTQNNDDDINSDLDDTDEDEEDGEGGEEIEHIILCLYDKVSRTKNKWKCVLKDGIMLVNGRDYLFHRANGDFEW